jgi:hypothetical protein
MSVRYFTPPQLQVCSLPAASLQTPGRSHVHTTPASDFCSSCMRITSVPPLTTPGRPTRR